MTIVLFINMNYFEVGYIINNHVCTRRDVADEIIARISRMRFSGKIWWCNIATKRAIRVNWRLGKGSGCLNTELPSRAYFVPFLGTVSVPHNTFFLPFLGTLTEGELSGARKIYLNSSLRSFCDPLILYSIKTLKIDKLNWLKNII